MNKNDLSLSDLRDKIDGIDREILAKISARANYAQQVGKVKRQVEGDSIVYYRPEREKQVLEKIKSLNEGPLHDNEVAQLFREIMSACLALEMPMNIAYLGPEGTFTQAAVLKQFGHSVKTSPERSIGDVFKAVETGACHYGLVPVENSTEGMVTHTLDTLALSPLNICGEVQIRIVQNLLTHATNFRDIKIIYAHGQSFAQCRKWLSNNIPHAELIVTLSNAEAAKKAAQEKGAAAIASDMASEYYGLPILSPGIEDDNNNTTRFLVIGKQETEISGADKTTLVVSAHNRPGLLYRLLEPIERHGVNMTRIESRPNRQVLWEYIFFIDLEGHQSQPEMQALFAEMKKNASLFRVLGSYPESAY